ncbi:MAG: hypothetical protein ABI852_10245 [Gemmatimonadaceae bacterium]
MRRILIFSLATMAGCATTSPTTSAGSGKIDEGPSPPRPTYLSMAGLRATYADAPAASVSVVRADPATVRQSIRKIFSQLDIPVTIDDVKQDAIGNTDFQKSARIGNHPMSEFVDCGSTAIGPRAATHRMYMSLITIVDSLSARRTRVKSTLAVSARDLSAASNARLHCSSTGALERLLGDSVTALAER